MKRYFKSGYNYIQDMVLEPGTYTFWARILSNFGDTFTFALANEAGEWEVFDVDVEMGQWSKVYEVFNITEKKVKLDLIHRYYDSEQPVFVFKPQLIKGNIPTDAGASPYDIDQITDDLHDSINGIADFTNEEFADRVLSASERISLKRDMEAVETIFQSLKGSYEKLIINPFVPVAVTTDLTTKYNAVTSAKTDLFNVLNLIIAGDDIVSPEEITAKDAALAALNTALYNYNQVEKEIQNALGADYTQKISAIRDFTDEEFADRYLSETEKISLSHDLDSVQTLVDSVTSRFNEMLLNPFLTEADRNLLIEKYNALLDAWDWDESIDPAKQNGLKTVILNIINDPDNIIDPVEMAEKDLALSAFNIALGEFSQTEVYISKITIDYAIEQATFWSLNATSPVIYKDSKDAVTDGHHMPITVKGQLHRGTQIQDGGFITVTADDAAEAAEATASPVLIEPADSDDKSLYTIRLYDSAAKTILLDTMTIPVVFRGNNGKDAINVTLSNEIDSVPASNEGVVSSYDNTGTDIRVFEGATELTYDGVGTSPGTYKVTSLGIDLTVGQISSPTAGILKCVVGNISNLITDKGITQFTITGKTLGNESFSEVKEQRITKGKMGAPGDQGEPGAGILSVVDWYAISTDGINPPGTGWHTTLPAKPANYYLWNYEVITYTDGRTPTQTQKRVIQGKDARSIYDIKNAYAYSESDTVSPTGGWQYSIAALGTKPTGYFLWVRDDIAYTDNPSNYIGTGSRVVRDGEPGLPGEDGDGITGTTIEYSKSSSGTIPPDGWSTSLPTPTMGWYLWTRITTTYKIAASTVAYSVSRWPNDGEPGSNGKGVSSVVIWYYKSSSATTQTGGSWSTTKPDYSASFFLWTKVITTYTDNSTTETTPILDPDWHKVMAITDKFGTTTEGGLIQTVMMLLRELNSTKETAGISGIQGALKNNPAFWSGGTHEQALALIEFLSKMSSGANPSAGEYAGLAKITMLHNGAAKVGDFIIESTGRIVMVDPVTGAARLVFGVENIPTIAALLSTTVYGETITIGSGTTTTSTSLTGSTNVTQDGSKMSFGGVNISITATGKMQSNGVSSWAAAILYALRDGVQSIALARSEIIFYDDVMTQYVMPTWNRSYNISSIPSGTYTFELVIETYGDVTGASASVDSSSFAWDFVQANVRRQQYGLDGMMFFYSDRHFHYTEGAGLDLRGPTDMPGKLLSGSVGLNGGFNVIWGAKKHASLNAVRNALGQYTVYHSIGHSDYSVQITPETSGRAFYVPSANKGNSSFVVYFTNLSGSAADAAFSFEISGSNY